MKIKLKSKRLNKEIEIEGYNSTLDDGSNVVILLHKSLLNFFDTLQIEDKELYPSINYEDVLISDNHCVIRAIITDKNNTIINEIGEVTPSSLNSKVAQKYPVVTAQNRATDRAIIRYLGIDGKVYSNEEIQCSEAPQKAQKTYNQSIYQKPFRMTQGPHKGQTIIDIFNCGDVAYLQFLVHQESIPPQLKQEITDLIGN